MSSLEVQPATTQPEDGTVSHKLLNEPQSDSVLVEETEHGFTITEVESAVDSETIKHHHHHHHHQSDAVVAGVINPALSSHQPHQETIIGTFPDHLDSSPLFDPSELEKLPAHVVAAHHAKGKKSKGGLVIPFDVSFFGIVTVKGYVDLLKGRVYVKVLVIGISLGTFDFSFENGLKLAINLIAISGSLRFYIVDDVLRLRIRLKHLFGEAVDEDVRIVGW